MGCTCHEIRAARIANVNAAKADAHARIVVQDAIYAALGCTDVRKPKEWPDAAKHMANVIIGELARNGYTLALTSKQPVP